MRDEPMDNSRSILDEGLLNPIRVPITVPVLLNLMEFEAGTRPLHFRTIFLKRQKSYDKRQYH